MTEIKTIEQAMSASLSPSDAPAVYALTSTPESIANEFDLDGKLGYRFIKRVFDIASSGRRPRQRSPIQRSPRRSSPHPLWQQHRRFPRPAMATGSSRPWHFSCWEQCFWASHVAVEIAAIWKKGISTRYNYWHVCL